MKKLLFVLTAFLMMAAFPASSHAVFFSFTDSPNVTLKGTTATPATYQKPFIIYAPWTDILSLDNASLSITMTGLQDKGAGSSSNWVDDSAAVYSIFSSTAKIGDLTSTANENTSVTNTFDLSSLLSSIVADNGNFKVSVVETTAGTKWQDGAVLNSIGFSGNYTLKPTDPGPLAPTSAVPEPATMTLLGIGLAGIGMLRRKQFKA